MTIALTEQLSYGDGTNLAGTTRPALLTIEAAAGEAFLRVERVRNRAEWFCGLSADGGLVLSAEVGKALPFASRDAAHVYRESREFLAALDLLGCCCYVSICGGGR